MKETLGEAAYRRRNNIDFSSNKDIGTQCLGLEKNLPNRMSREKAFKYYGDKLTRVFDSLGYVNKKSLREAQLKFEEEELINLEPTLRDFDNDVDSYFAYFEAVKYRNELLSA